jgi:putative membrane protein
MGTADLVPGVSGGTIALVLGIYERLVSSIREGSSALGSIIKGNVERFKDHLGRVEWGFLLPLLGGILLAVVLLASFLEHQLEVRPTVVAGVFFGLVVGSVVIAWALIKEPHNRHLGIVAVVAIGLFLVLGLGESEGGADPSFVAFFGAGALAVCAMILPGISGSLILLMLGMYTPVLGAVTDRDFVTVGVVALGAVVGLAFFSQILHWALEHHHDNVLAALIGLMAGSTRVLWPWPEGVESPHLGAPGDDWALVVGSALVGAVAVYLISRLANGQEKISTT